MSGLSDLEIAEMRNNPNLVPASLPLGNGNGEASGSLISPLTDPAPAIKESRPKYGQLITFAKCSLCCVKRYILVNLRGLFCTTCLKDLLDTMVKVEVESLERIQRGMPVPVEQEEVRYAIPEQKAQRLDRVVMAGGVSAQWGT